MMITLYHITPKANISSIATQGLLINQRSCMTKASDSADKIRTYGVIPIFLCEDPLRLAKEQLTSGWIEQSDPVVLSVDVYGVPVVQEYAHLTWFKDVKHMCFTWVSLKNIEPQRIAISSHVLFL